MRLVIKDDITCELLEGITLEDGWRPCVDMRSFSCSEEESFVIPQIQVAVWFKTLVLTSVTIDCSARCVTWSTKSTELYPVPADTTSRMANQLTEWSLMKTRDKYHTDEVADLFKLTAECLQVYIAKKHRATFYERMLNILHCFVLPSITLARKDITFLEAALSMQKALITRQDDNVNEAMGQVTELRKHLADFRMQMIDDINLVYGGQKEKKDIKKVKVPSKFIQQLLLDLGQDTRKIAAEITAAQSDQDVIAKQIQEVLPAERESFEQRVKSSFKQKALKSNDMTHLMQLFKMNAGLLKPKLQRALKIKEEIIQKHETTTAAMEVLQSNLDKMKKSKTHTKFKILRQKSKSIKKEIGEYLKTCDNLRVHKDRIMYLLNIKVQLISVREAILSSLCTLSTGDVENTYGVEYSMEGHGATDVLVEEVTLNSWWKTLEEQVMTILDHTQSTCSQNHFTFLADILFQCDIIYSKLKLQVARQHNVGIVNIVGDDTSVMADVNCSILGCVQNICSCINNHVMEMVEQLQPLVMVGKNNPGKIQHCYERLLFNKIGESVTSVYQLAFKEQTTQIRLHLGHMTAELLELENSSVLEILVQKECRKDVSQHNDKEFPGSISGLLRRSHSTPTEAQLARKKTFHRKACVKSVEQQVDEPGGTGEKHFLLLDKLLSKRKADIGNKTSKYASVVDPCEMNTRKLADLSSGYDFRGSLPVRCVDDVYTACEQYTSQRDPGWCITKQENSKGSLNTYDSASSDSEDSDVDVGQVSDEIHVICNHKEMDTPDKFARVGRRNDVEKCLGNNKCERVTRDSEPTLTQSVLLKDEHHKELLPIFSMLEELCSLSAPVEKYRKGFQISQTLGTIGAKLLGVNNIEIDTLNDLLVVVLCNVRADLAAELFLNTEQMKDFLPAAYEINEYGFMITFWEGIWTFLLDKVRDFSTITNSE